jgi:hypothetical protein
MREELELEFKNKLKGYQYIENDKINQLQVNFFVRYIKREPRSLALGGRIESIMVDKNDNTKIYKLMIKNSTGGTWPLLINDKVFIYFKTRTVAEERALEATKWTQSLTPEEFVLFTTMKEQAKCATTQKEKKRIKDVFYNYYYDKHPDKKPTIDKKVDHVTVVKTVKVIKTKKP